jgi:hypothetical protein
MRVQTRPPLHRMVAGRASGRPDFAGAQSRCPLSTWKLDHQQLAVCKPQPSLGTFHPSPSFRRFFTSADRNLQLPALLRAACDAERSARRNTVPAEAISTWTQPGRATRQPGNCVPHSRPRRPGPSAANRDPSERARPNPDGPSSSRRRRCDRQRSPCPASPRRDRHMRSSRTCGRTVGARRERGESNDQRDTSATKTRMPEA